MKAERPIEESQKKSAWPQVKWPRRSLARLANSNVRSHSALRRAGRHAAEAVRAGPSGEPADDPVGHPAGLPVVRPVRDGGLAQDGAAVRWRPTVLSVRP
jgi:hypothetical protein